MASDEDECPDQNKNDDVFDEILGLKLETELNRSIELNEVSLPISIMDAINVAEQNVIKFVKEEKHKRNSRLVVISSSSEDSKSDLASLTIDSVPENKTNQLDFEMLEDITPPSFEDSIMNLSDDLIPLETNLGYGCEELDDKQLCMGFRRPLRTSQSDSLPNMTGEINGTFLERETNAVLDALKVSPPHASPDKRMTILDLSKLCDALIDSPIKSDKKCSTTPQMSTPKAHKYIEDLYSEFSDILHGLNLDIKEPHAQDQNSEPVNEANNIEFYHNLTETVQCAEEIGTVDDMLKNIPQESKINTTFGKELPSKSNSTFDMANKFHGDAHNGTFDKKESENIAKDLNIIAAKVDANSTHDVISDCVDVEMKDNQTFRKEEDCELPASVMNRTFECIGNGNFMVDGTQTNLMDMGSNVLETIVTSTPTKGEEKPFRRNSTPVYRKHKRKASEKGRSPTLLKYLTTLNGFKKQDGVANHASSDENSALSHAELLKMHRSRNKEPLKTGPLKVIAPSQGRPVISTPPSSVKNTKLSTASCDSEKDTASLGSFGKMSSIGSNSATTPTDCGTPEMLRSYGPRQTSTPATLFKFCSKQRSILNSDNAPTPIVPPPYRGDPWKRLGTVTSLPDVSGIISDNNSGEVFCEIDQIKNIFEDKDIKDAETSLLTESQLNRNFSNLDEDIQYNDRREIPTSCTQLSKVIENFDKFDIENPEHNDKGKVNDLEEMLLDAKQFLDGTINLKADDKFCKPLESDFSEIVKVNEKVGQKILSTENLNADLASVESTFTHPVLQNEKVSTDLGSIDQTLAHPVLPKEEIASVDNTFAHPILDDEKTSTDLASIDSTLSHPILLVNRIDKEIAPVDITFAHPILQDEKIATDLASIDSTLACPILHNNEIDEEIARVGSTFSHPILLEEKIATDLTSIDNTLTHPIFPNEKIATEIKSVDKIFAQPILQDEKIATDLTLINHNFNDPVLQYRKIASDLASIDINFPPILQDQKISTDLASIDSNFAQPILQDEKTDTDLASLVDTFAKPILQDEIDANGSKSICLMSETFNAATLGAENPIKMCGVKNPNILDQTFAHGAPILFNQGISNFSPKIIAVVDENLDKKEKEPILDGVSSPNVPIINMNLDEKNLKNVVVDTLSEETPVVETSKVILDNKTKMNTKGTKKIINPSPGINSQKPLEVRKSLTSRRTPTIQNTLSRNARLPNSRQSTPHRQTPQRIMARTKCKNENIEPNLANEAQSKTNSNQLQAKITRKPLTSNKNRPSPLANTKNIVEISAKSARLPLRPCNAQNPLKPKLTSTRASTTVDSNKLVKNVNLPRSSLALRKPLMPPVKPIAMPSLQLKIKNNLADSKKPPSIALKGIPASRPPMKSAASSVSKSLPTENLRSSSPRLQAQVLMVPTTEVKEPSTDSAISASKLGVKSNLSQPSRLRPPTIRYGSGIPKPKLVK